MQILMATNTYFPHLGGVARSVKGFTDFFRERGHRVLVVAPEFPNQPEAETDVVRLPALQRFNGSDFSLRLPIPTSLEALLGDFQPDIVHSHHPFLLGDTAQRIAARYHVPLIFTHHTLYERYTHYVPGDSQLLKDFVVYLTTGYANLCQGVIAPSVSLQRLLLERGVTAPIEVIPTGVKLEHFSSASRERGRAELKIPKGAWLLGHVGRLAPEKNLIFLARASAMFMKHAPEAHLLVVGEGPSLKDMKKIFRGRLLKERVHFSGALTGERLADAYKAMDTFVFSSLTETQGIVLAEAMAAGVPVVALEGPGVRDIIEHGRNGILVRECSLKSFFRALLDLYCFSPEQRQGMIEKALQSVADFSLERCAGRILSFYERIVSTGAGYRENENSSWETAVRRLKMEWDLISNRADALGRSIFERLAGNS